MSEHRTDTNSGRTPLRVLIVEDSELDARLLVSILRKSGYAPDFRRVETSEDMKEALNNKKWDVILADYNMPEFSAPEALKIAQEHGSDIPFIIVSGGIGEDTAVAAMKAGAHDYLMKGNLARLTVAVERELRESAMRESRRHTQQALIESELHYRSLWETSTDAVLIIDHENRIQFANPAVESVFGYKPEELIGRNISILQSSEQEKPLEPQRQWFGNQTKSIKGRRVETTALKKDGTPIIVEIAFSEMELHGKNRTVAFIRDITERRLTEQKLHETQEQFRVAREIQQRLFPQTSPVFPKIDIAGASYPADATGGDYFDYPPMIDGSLGIVIGDVTGHGVGPAMLMAETRAYLRILARNRADVGDILNRANRILAEDIDPERYVTLLFVKIDHRSKSITYANAGHTTGFLLDSKGRIKSRLERTGLPLGIQPDAHYNAVELPPLESGDSIILMTDGIEEAISPNNEFFGFEKILEVTRANYHKSAREIVNSLYHAVREFTGNSNQEDDITSVALKMLP
ncbi:MAG: SpoIIE family protein phosphatase [Verrucomicrobia bacterium]|nr:SpoIIE family protein phosphatase [Verrucomicrobiota bacterium]MCF7709451.1 SpoIIE family protein phosphatase [Verrucomicrobiota bacterium]